MAWPAWVSQSCCRRGRRRGRRPRPPGRAADRRAVDRSGRDPPPHFPANLSCSRVRRHAIRRRAGSRRRRDRRLSRRHQRLSRCGRRARDRPRRTLRHRSDRPALERQPASREGRRGGVLTGSPRVPAGRVDAVRRRGNDELLAVHLRVRAGEHRHHRRRHTRRAGWRRALVAVARWRRSSLARRAIACSTWEDAVYRSPIACSATAVGCGRCSCSRTAAAGFSSRG